MSQKFYVYGIFGSFLFEKRQLSIYEKIAIKKMFKSGNNSHKTIFKTGRPRKEVSEARWQSRGGDKKIKW